ncbi:dimethylaniline monooxygenase [N-oxide-forming] 2 isoform X1 [Podarcis lilfordi]|uniref:Flavin-containing monooxygenase n=1 Tax=Podarcis lilfordi TaxID=74358 RepID=A0AA35KFF8_9SAUR|nr:dimethylaniline monooxygenase [N-oxide-forming] 2 isoform X1 [Podarcis lilfordi]
MVRRVAIVGAGVSGLASIKCCLDEGLEPTCFEKSDGIGGLWQFTETPQKGRIGVYRSVMTNTSKEMTCFSDFPFPEDCPNYLRHSALLEYLRAYAKHFCLLDYIRFQTTVCSIRKHPHFTATGQWVVDTETNGEQTSEIFDGVMVCSGHYAEINLPLDSFPGIENFKGRYFHSWEYRDQKGFEGQKVLVVGAGNTGGDLAVDISRTAAKVFLSTRSGAWVISRISEAGWPVDMAWTTRFYELIEKLLPEGTAYKLMAKKINRWFNHENYGLIPVKSNSWTSLILNDELPSCILCGTVTVKPNVKRFTDTSAVFEDETVEENIDTVIFTTGYSATFPFLEESLRDACRSSTSLYKHIFPPHLEKPTLAFVGFIALAGPILPAAELQARWITRVFNGSSELPPMSRLISEVAKRKNALLKKGITDISSKKDKTRMKFVSYMDEIAACLGVKPNVPLLFLSDPKLAWMVFFGPCTSYQYRLTGPGKWREARGAILTQWDRVLKPLKTRVVEDSPQPATVPHWVKALALPIFLGAALIILKYLPPAWLPRRNGWSVLSSFHV